MNAHTLTRHRDIQAWASDHRGAPAVRRIPNRFGEMRAELALTFRAPKASPDHGMPRVDDGLSPVSWTAWLAELDRRQLAVRVFDRANPDFELVPRASLN